MAASLLASAQDLLRIRPEEVQRTLNCFVYLFMAMGAFVLARIVRTVLFLEIPNYQEQLPFIYIVMAATSSLVMYGYVNVEGRLRRHHTNLLTLGLLGAVTLIFRGFLAVHSPLLAWLFYLWVDVFGTLLMVQFWSLTNEMFDSRQGKRLFALIGGGSVVANIAFGLSAGLATRLIGVDNLLYIVCFCLLICAGIVRRLGSTIEKQSPGARRPFVQPRTAKKTAASFDAHIVLVAAVTTLTYLVSTWVDYQFQIVIAESIAGADARGAYLGTFLGVTGFLAGLMQFFVASSILARFGVLVALVILPVTMVMGSTASLFPALGALSTITFTKGAENVLRYTIHDSTLQLMYLPVPQNLRGLTKAWVDGVIKPLAIGAAGVILVIIATDAANLAYLRWTVLSVLALWLVAVARLQKSYLTGLVESLHHRRLNIADTKDNIRDPATIDILNRFLHSSEAHKVIHSLELITACDPSTRDVFDSQVLELLAHENSLIRERAVAYLHNITPASAQLLMHKILPLLHDNRPYARAAACAVIGPLYGEQSYRLLEPYVTDPDVTMRSAAIACLIRYARGKGLIRCAAPLSATIFPSIAPKPTISTRSPKVPPTPF